MVILNKKLDIATYAIISNTKDETEIPIKLPPSIVSHCMNILKEKEIKNLLLEKKIQFFH